MNLFIYFSHDASAESFPVPRILGLIWRYIGWTLPERSSEGGEIKNDLLDWSLRIVIDRFSYEWYEEIPKTSEKVQGYHIYNR